MKRKLLFTFTILIVLSLFTTGLALAKGLGEWTEAFNAYVNGYEDLNAIWAVEKFQSNLYVAVIGFQGIQIYRSPDGEKWEAVSERGFGNLSYLVSWDMQVFNDGLYVIVNDGGYFGSPGAVLRTFNGTDWTVVLDPGDDLNGSLVDKLGIFQEKLYMTTASTGPESSSQIWRSETGDPFTWELVKELGSDVWSTSSPIVFKDFLYISGHSETRGILLWRSANGLDWENVNVASQFAPNIFMDGNLAVFQGELYLSALDDIDGGSIYRSNNGLDWQPVVEGGLGDPANQDIVGLIVYHGSLFAGVYNSDCGCVKLLTSKTGNPGDWNLDIMTGWPESGTGIVRGSQAVFKDDLYFADTNIFGSLYRMLHP